MKLKLLAFSLTIILAYPLCLADVTDPVDLKVGQRFVLRLTGNFAERYSSITGFPKENVKELVLSLPAEIEEVFNDGTVRITSSSQAIPVSGRQRIVTIDMNVLHDQFSLAENNTWLSKDDFAKRGILPALISQKQCLEVSLSDVGRGKLHVWELLADDAK